MFNDLSMQHHVGEKSEVSSTVSIAENRYRSFHTIDTRRKASRELIDRARVRRKFTGRDVNGGS